MPKVVRVPMEIAAAMMDDSFKSNRKHCGEDTPEGYGCRLAKSHKGPHFSPDDLGHQNTASWSVEGDDDDEFDAAYDRFKLTN